MERETARWQSRLILRQQSGNQRLIIHRGGLLPDPVRRIRDDRVEQAMRRRPKEVEVPARVRVGRAHGTGESILGEGLSDALV